MLRGLIERPISVLIVALVVVLVGSFSLLQLPVALLPALERPRILIEIEDADRARGDLVEVVLVPLERRLITLESVTEVRTLVEDGYGRLEVTSEWQTDVDALRIAVGQRLASVAAGDLDRFEVSVESSDLVPVLALAVVGGSASARTTYAERILIPELARQPGAGKVRRLGGAHLRPVVRPEAAALAARGLTAADVGRRLERVGRGLAAGELRDGALLRSLLIRETVRSLPELADLRLGEDRDAVLGDVASVALEEVPAASLVRVEGSDAVLVELYRAPGANAVRLAASARQALAELAGRATQSLQVVTLRDSSREVVAALWQLAQAGLIGFFLGTLVLRTLLGSWRPTLALALVVPASILSSFAAFRLASLPLDVVALASLALAAGMLIDNSIVVLETIAGAAERGAGAPEVSGTERIALPLLGGFLTTAVVFLPLIYLRGLARAFFGVQAFAIVAALAVSLAFSLSLTPVLSRLLRARRPLPTRGRHPGLGVYLAALEATLKRPWSVLAFAVALLVGVALLGAGVWGPGFSRQLLPAAPPRALTVEVRLPTGIERQAAARRLTTLEQAVAAEVGEAVATTTLRFHGDTDGSPREAFRGELDLTLGDTGTAAELGERLATRLATLAGLETRVIERSGTLSEIFAGLGDSLVIEASAATEERAEALAQRLVADLGETWQIRGQADRRPIFDLAWNDQRLARLGSHREQLTAQVRAGLGGVHAGRVAIEGVEADILLAGVVADDLQLLPVRVPRSDPSEGETTRVVPLAAVASVAERNLEPASERVGSRPTARRRLAAGHPQMRDPVRLATRLEGMLRAPDEKVRLAGTAYEIKRSFTQLRLALALGVVLVFLTLAALYESLTLPLVVMATVPVAITGALATLWVSGESLNIMSLLGMILLAGIVVNNAIVLVHRGEQRRAAGEAPQKAIHGAATERYRPILMTTLTTLLGLLPLVLVAGEGQELRRPLALAVSGGLATAWLATLLLVPALYRLLMRGPQESAG